MSVSHRPSYTDRAIQRRQRRTLRLALLNSAIAAVVLLSLSLIGMQYLSAKSYTEPGEKPLPTGGDPKSPTDEAPTPYRLNEPIYIVAEAVSVNDLSNNNPYSGGENSFPYCFEVMKETQLYAAPSFSAAIVAGYQEGDIAYATNNPPSTVWVDDSTTDGNSFIEVAIYDGSIAWVSRYSRGNNSPVLADLACPQRRDSNSGVEDNPPPPERTQPEPPDENVAVDPVPDTSYIASITDALFKVFDGLPEQEVIADEKRPPENDPVEVPNVPEQENNSQVEAKALTGNDYWALKHRKVSSLNDESLKGMKSPQAIGLTSHLILDLATNDYKIWSLQHRKVTLTDQKIQGKIVFWLVLLIVAFGIVISAIQFYDQLRGAPSKNPNQKLSPEIKSSEEQEPNTSENDTSQPKTDDDGKKQRIPSQQVSTPSKFRIGLDGVEMSSSILGLLVLGLSLGFLYLYLVHVFEIKELGTSPLTEIPVLNEVTSESPSDTGTQAEPE